MVFFKFDRKREKKDHLSKAKPSTKAHEQHENRLPSDILAPEKESHKNANVHKVAGLKEPLPLSELRQTNGFKESMPSSDARQPRTVNDFVTKTKCRHQQGLKPTGPELVAFARYLGMDPVGQNDLMWIAEEALLAPLPRDWTEHFDSIDRVFYYNNSTKTSSWTHPMEATYRDTYETIVNFRSSTILPQNIKEHLEQWQKEVEESDRKAEEEIASWTECQDSSGKTFYFNKKEGVSTWTDPRPAVCYTLYIKLKMVRILTAHIGLGPSAIPSLASNVHNTAKRESSGGSMPSSSSPKVIAEEDDDIEYEFQCGYHDTKKKKNKKKHSVSEPSSSDFPPFPPSDFSIDTQGVDRLRGHNYPIGRPPSTCDEPNGMQGTGLPRSGHTRFKANIRLSPLRDRDVRREMHASSSLPLFPTKFPDLHPEIIDVKEEIPTLT
eukprot:GEMP01029803.1.p1 GENE.GEMP01029803.1~~GEMP01029803.1.p1  ORF type:complete len:437 (+),score=90.00 GEMP01029803.1:139-1449(+)